MPAISMFYGVVIYLYYLDNRGTISPIFMQCSAKQKVCLPSNRASFLKAISHFPQFILFGLGWKSIVKTLWPTGN